MNSTATQPTLLELAKQGNAQAIATLINRQLQPKGITAKAALKDGCLQVMLESAQAPNQQALVAFVRKGITGLRAASIERVKVYGRLVGEEFPAWSEEFELAQPNPFDDLPAVPDRGNQQTSQSISVEVEGINGQIRLTQNRVIISRKGAKAFVTQGLKGDKEIPISRITAIQFKPADNLTNGYLQFSIEGGLESKGGVFAATQDENTVMFSVFQQPVFEEVKRYVDSIMDGSPLSLSMLRLSELKAQGFQAEERAKVQAIEAEERAKVQAIKSDKLLAKKAIPVLSVVAAISFWGILITSAESGLKALFILSLVTSGVCLVWAWVKNSSSLPALSDESQQKPWYKRDFGIILLLIFFWPVGLYLMWKYSKWSTPVKWTLTAICSFMFFTAIS
jgi:hypothetical protein